MNNLRELQELFISALSDRTTNSNKPSQLAEKVRAGKTTREKRVFVYTNAYIARLIEVASDLYPLLFKYLGEENFNNLWIAYLNEHPPSGHSLRSIGDNLGDFIQEVFPERNELRDLARLETAQIKVFDIQSFASLRTKDLLEIPPANWNELVLQANTNWNLIKTQFDLLNLDSRINNEATDHGDKSSSRQNCIETGYLVYRPENEVLTERLERPLLVFLEGMLEYSTFAAICDSLMDETDTMEDAAALAAAQLNLAIEKKLIRKF